MFDNVQRLLHPHDPSLLQDSPPVISPGPSALFVRLGYQWNLSTEV